jgi:hypothetical protein
MKPVVVAFAALAIAAGLSAQSSDLDGRIDREMPSLIETYKTLHASPELSGHEEKTAAWLAAELQALGYTVTDHLGKYFADLVGFGVAGVSRTAPGPPTWRISTRVARRREDGPPTRRRCRQRTRRADGQCHARMRPRHPHVGVSRHRIASGRRRIGGTAPSS